MDNKALLTKMIVANALNNKPCEGLLFALREEFAFQVEEEGGGEIDEVMGVVESAEECEKVMADVFVAEYTTRLDHNVDTETCLEVFSYPEWMPEDGIPRSILEQVGREMARRDAAEANEMRRQVIARGKCR